jgi:hypothetical protein
MLRSAIIGLTLSAFAFAQADRGNLTGTISDPQGAVISAAKILLRNAQTGSEYPTVSTSTGNYSIAQPGFELPRAGSWTEQDGPKGRRRMDGQRHRALRERHPDRCSRI